MVRRASVLAAIVAVLSFGLGARGDAEPTSLEDVSAPWYLDGARRVDVERVGLPALRTDLSGVWLTPIKLHYADRPVAVDAWIDRTAIVRVAPGREGDLAAQGLELVKPLMESIGLWLVQASSGVEDGLDLALRLGKGGLASRGIEAVVPNLYLERTIKNAPFVPDDPKFPGQWFWKNLKMTEAWGLTKGDPSTGIVVVDTGCDLKHEDLAAKMDPGRDVVDEDDDPSYDPAVMGTGHGTSCAGLVAAVTDNKIGIAGACPDCRLRCVRLISDTAIPLARDVEAFDFALKVNAAVVSNSWGYKQAMPVPMPLADAINNVFDHGRNGKGALVVFAMGNDSRQVGLDELEAVRGVLAIGAITNNDEPTSFTNFGDPVDLVAPTGTLTTDITGALGSDPTDYTANFGGTSSACPVAAGICGLLVTAAPDKTSQELYDILIKTARPAAGMAPDKNGHDPMYGFGIIDPVKALESVLMPIADAGPDAAQTTSGSGGGSSVTTGGGPSPEGKSGCSCELGPEGGPSPWLLAYAAPLALFLARGRRRRR